MKGSHRSTDGARRVPRAVLSLLALLPVVSLLVACAAAAGGGARASPSASGGTGAKGMGSGLTVDEAAVSDSNVKLLVKGYLVADARGARLCSALAESDPPQCAGRSLTVHGLNLDSVSGLTTSGGTTWSSSELKLVGYVRNGVLTVDSGTSA